MLSLQELRRIYPIMYKRMDTDFNAGNITFKHIS